MTNEGLKPCPICGGEAETSETAGIKREALRGWGWIGCRKCHVFTEYIENEKGREQAKEAWNRRAT